jgi:hypothetical protein
LKIRIYIIIGNGCFIYLPVSIASWWALILILVMRDLLNLGRSKLRYCFKSNDVQRYINNIRIYIIINTLLVFKLYFNWRKCLQIDHILILNS